MRVALALVLAGMLSGCLAQFTPVPEVVPQDYLQATPYGTWVIEVDYAKGAAPSQDLMNFLHGRLSQVANKPGGIQFQLDESLTPESRTWTTQSLITYAAAHKGQSTGSGTVVTHLLFLRGGTDADTDNSKVLGVTIGYDLIVIFVDAIESSCNEVPLGLFCSTGPIYRATTLHEFGHAIGLVNRGVEMVNPHEARECNGKPDSGHSDNQNSVMYCAVSTSQIAQLFGNTPPDTFDSNDRTDLRKAGGK